MRVYEIKLDKRCVGQRLYVIGSSDQAVERAVAKNELWINYKFIADDHPVVKDKKYYPGVYSIRYSTAKWKKQYREASSN